MDENNGIQKSSSNNHIAMSGHMSSVESSRAIAEVQGQVMMAKQFPRDSIQARFNIIEACKRKRLAETAIYSYPKGGSQVEGPSIRLAEMLAQSWGNIDFGIIELDKKDGTKESPGESLLMAFARDIQTNTRQQVVFSVPHVRYTRKDGNKTLTDPRDIYEMGANMGARRLRKCILGIIPGDIVEDAVEACNKTLLGDNDEPLIDRIKKMVAVFSKIGVSQSMIEKKLGHKMEATMIIEVVRLGKIYKSINDDMSGIKDWFETPKAEAEKSEIVTFNKASEQPKELPPNVKKLQAMMNNPEYDTAFVKSLGNDEDGNPFTTTKAIKSAINDKNDSEAKHIIEAIMLFK